MTIRKITTEYKINTENGALELIEKVKQQSNGVVTYKVDYKAKYSRAKETLGELIEEYWLVTIKETFTD